MRRWQMIAGESRCGGTRWRKVRTPYGSMPRKIRGQDSSGSSRMDVDGKCHRNDTAGSLRKAQARVKRRGKSSPRPAQAGWQEKPHAVQDKTGGGQPVRQCLEEIRGRSPGIVAPRCVKNVVGVEEIR